MRHLGTTTGVLAMLDISMYDSCHNLNKDEVE